MPAFPCSDSFHLCHVPGSSSFFSVLLFFSILKISLFHPDILFLRIPMNQEFSFPPVFVLQEVFPDANYKNTTSPQFVQLDICIPTILHWNSAFLYYQRWLILSLSCLPYWLQSSAIFKYFSGSS